jgi:predicted acyltransferase (DUF342 family)
MSFRSAPLDRLRIPDGTVVEEHDLVTDGDVVVGGQSTVEFGVRGRTVIGGERVRFGGDIEADGDCRLDVWCDVAGNVLAGEDAYVGERVHIGGELIVSGDLDIGDDVEVEEGFDANGWIVIRNPVPTVVFLFIYLSQLLRLGEEEAAEDLIESVRRDPEAEPLVIPRSARVSDDAWRVSTPADVGADCRLHGNLRAERITVGRDTELFGSLRAKGDVHLERGVEIHGDVTTRAGVVRIERGAHVRGDVSCEDLVLDDDAEIEGAIRARGEVSISRGRDDDAPGRTDDPVDETADLHEEVAEPTAAISRVHPREDDGLTPAIVPVDPRADGADDGDGDGDVGGDDEDPVDIPDAEAVAAAEEAATHEDGLAGALAEAERR